MTGHDVGVSMIVQLEQWMVRSGYADGTIKQRMARVRALDVPLGDATAEDVLRSLPPDLSAATRRVYVSALSAAFRDLMTMGLVDHNPCIGIRTPGFHRGAPQPLADGLVERLLAEQGPERDWTVLGVYGGLRASDVAGLYADDLVETIHGPGVQLLGKGNRSAVIPAHPLVVEVFRRNDHRGPLWRVPPQQVSVRWARWVLRLTGETHHFHQCRHTFATRVYAASGQDLLVTRDLMRHSSVATTQIYAQVGDDRGYAAVSGL